MSARSNIPHHDLESNWVINEWAIYQTITLGELCITSIEVVFVDINDCVCLYGVPKLRFRG